MFHPQWSPDGQSIAYLSDRTSQYAMLWLMNANGANQRQLTRPRGSLDTYDRFAWSPDGSQIAITGYSGTQSQIYVLSVARPDAPRAITSEAGSAFDPAWSPDGRYIAYAARDGRRYAIKLVDMEAGDPPTTLVTGDMARSPRWAPWGGSLAYLAMAGSDFEIFVVNVTPDGDGHISAGRPSQITNRFGVEATSGLSWAP
jgi:TolB protein